MKKLKILIIPLMVLILSGCDNRKCVKSHKERSTCVSSIYNGKYVTPFVYPCTKTVCDEYEEAE